MALRAILVHKLAGNAIALGYGLRRLQHRPIHFRLFSKQGRIGKHVLVHFILHAGDRLNAARNINVTLTADHRAVDGAAAAEFLQTFKSLLEEPAMMLL